jgi:hypothetical protein
MFFKKSEKDLSEIFGIDFAAVLRQSGGNDGKRRRRWAADG